ncbi:uncharacterized mitochondrial protein AtMg00810-like [Arachis duranensis]|uniref:Uncharacterized mitochondrial protein AtMg00810-like n=1 Tax=Arachis duranensis TaxID=130453 RepID=A0A6P4DBV3_ARADU|nr:uncharacterized mitochondrial protein AtMg00810-like [Arachis duranensis]
METANLMPTPMMSYTKLSAHYSEHFHDLRLYRSIVGALQYLIITRSDIAFAVNRVSQFMHQPTLLHWKCVKRILRYVKGTVDHGLLFSKSTDFRLLAFSDADWGGGLDDKKSITGFCVYLGSNLISWKSNKQTKVSKSSTEAEYRAMCAAQTELMSIQQLLGEVRIP